MCRINFNFKWKTYILGEMGHRAHPPMLALVIPGCSSVAMGLWHCASGVGGGGMLVNGGTENSARYPVWYLRNLFRKLDHHLTTAPPGAGRVLRVRACRVTCCQLLTQ